MTEQGRLDPAIHERVQIVPYDIAWPGKFEAERARLLPLFPDEFVAIEHFGSAAIPAMSAEPIIDIPGGVRSWNSIDALSRRRMAWPRQTGRRTDRSDRCGSRRRP